MIKPHFNRQSPNPGYDQRFDLSADGQIKLQDVLMMKPYYGGLGCT